MSDSHPVMRPALLIKSRNVRCEGVRRGTVVTPLRGPGTLNSSAVRDRPCGTSAPSFYGAVTTGEVTIISEASSYFSRSVWTSVFFISYLIFIALYTFYLAVPARHQPLSMRRNSDYFKKAFYSSYTTVKWLLTEAASFLSLYKYISYRGTCRKQVSSCGHCYKEFFPHQLLTLSDTHTQKKARHYREKPRSATSSSAMTVLCPKQRRSSFPTDWHWRLSP